MKIHENIENLTRLEIIENAAPAPASAILPPATELSQAKGATAFQRTTNSLKAIHDRKEARLTWPGKRRRMIFPTANLIMVCLCAAGMVIGLFAGVFLARSIGSKIDKIVDVANAVAEGNLDTAVTIDTQDGEPAGAIMDMQSALKDSRDQAETRAWLKNGMMRFNDAVRGRWNTSGCRYPLQKRFSPSSSYRIHDSRHGGLN